MNNSYTYWHYVLASALMLQGCNKEGPLNPPVKFEHKDNVFAEVGNWYNNDKWATNAKESEGSAIANHSTAVWLYSTKHVDLKTLEIPDDFDFRSAARIPPATTSLTEHFQRAEEQGNALLQLVLNNAPEKNCDFRLTTGELPPSKEGFQLYQQKYIDPIAKIISEYPHIPVAIIIEPDTWPNLVKERSKEDCRQVSNTYSHGYTNAIRYAINTLSPLQNVHIYLDIGSSNHLGWEADMQIAPLFAHGIIAGFEGLAAQVKPIGEAIEHGDGATGLYDKIELDFVEPPKAPMGNTSPPGYDKIDGFISNVADYIPLHEPYLGDPLLPIGGGEQLQAALFYDWNPRFDEWTYTKDWMDAITHLSPDDTSHLGVIIDTSRNGWGQAHSRLVGTEPTQDINQVNDQRIDQRKHRQSWCNQSGGIGKRPQANPDKKAWIDAYVWAKAPGESDGEHDVGFSIDPNESPYRRMEMCDPNGSNHYAEDSPATADLDLPTGAMADAPSFTLWFEDGFKVLTENAWPPLCEGENDDC